MCYASGKSIFLCSLLLMFLIGKASAAILSVALDGSQGFTTIRAAIDASADTDTVLVHPGRYYENVRFNGRNITLASLELLTGNRDYIYTTIIDANRNGGGIRVADYETDITIQGFTVVNGTGSYNEQYDWYTGGGISVGRMGGQRSARIVNCQVTDNHADNGAGVYLGYCQAYLSGLSIHHNMGGTGAGIYFAGSQNQYNSTFDPINRCSIYSNYAAFGSDMYYYNVNSVNVVVDTFTVANPWNFYATAIPRNPAITNPYTFDILHTVHEEVNHDLYVAPWGDDANSGLSASEPMRSVFMAMYRIASDSLAPKTVYVADGHYSPSLNNQLFPIPVKSYIRLIGESREGTIIDADSNSYVINVSAHTQDFGVRNMTLRNGNIGFSASYSNSWSIDNIRIINMHDIRLNRGISDYSAKGYLTINDVVISNVESPSASGVFLGFMEGCIDMRNVEVEQCSANDRLMAIEISTRAECDILIDGCTIHNNNNNSPDVFNTIMQISPFSTYGTRLRIEIRDSAFYDNHQAMPAQMGNVRSLNDTLFIDNCTFAGNTGGSAALAVQGTSVLTNNIFWNPALSTEVYIPNYISSGINSHSTFSYNNILDGIDGVVNATSQNPLIWGDGNTDYDPLFAMGGNTPYTLSQSSPLIDAGWQCASGLAEPGYDAGGNERLWDGDGDGAAVIDKGAYEYQILYAPANLSAEVSGPNVFLDWEQPSVNRSLSGYRVFRNSEPYARIDDPGRMSFRDHITQTDTLRYRVAALYGEVESEPSNEVAVYVEAVPNAEDLEATGLDYLLAGPNPFREFAVLRLGLSRAAEARLEILNLRGQAVKTIEGGRLGKGEHVLWWNADDAEGRAVTSGIYLCRLYLDGKAVHTRKLTYVK
jgi:hypothetical protein